MKGCNTGPGVYRSSRMNALRVTVTDTNRGYRMCDAERGQQLDFVIGYEVRRSQNHHPCVICYSLKGKYPKNFISGWHPFCICYAVPIVMEHDDFADFLLHDDIPNNQNNNRHFFAIKKLDHRLYAKIKITTNICKTKQVFLLKLTHIESISNLLLSLVRY